MLEKIGEQGLDSRDRLVALASSQAPLLGMSTEEHTAQIGTDDLEDFEQRFKSGALNVLVCSTTMELGIDIGGLSATLLTNVPPGASNYLQRAGRAGRRAEGTSLVMTFARPRPFDQAAFAEPSRPFKERITPPRVQLDSKRIVQRHANALLLAQFFRRYRAEADAKNPMASLRTVGEFVDLSLGTVLTGSDLDALLKDASVNAGEHTLSDAFVAWISGDTCDTEQSGAAVQRLVSGTVLANHPIGVIAERAAAHMRTICANVRKQLQFLRNECAQETAKPVEEQDDGKIKALTMQIEDLLNEKLLGYLAEEQFLPRYGFPIQVVRLEDSYEYHRRDRQAGADDESGLRLSRDISLALNEYAPGAEVVAGKHLHRSSGLLRHWTGSDAPGVLSARLVAVCLQCGRLQYARTQGEVRIPCPTCHEGIPRSIPVILPKEGFAVQWGVAPRRWTAGIKAPMRPVTESAYAAREGESVLEVSPALALAYDEEGQILVRSEGQLDPTELPGVELRGTATPRAGYGYAICYLCGRAEPEEHTTPEDGKKDALPAKLLNHRRLRGSRACESSHQYWRHMALAGAVRTETLTVQFRGSAQLPQGPLGHRLATTWMVALQLAAGEVLGVDSRQIGGLLVPRSVASGVVYDVLLYDQVAGGVGHCRALLDRWKDLLEAAKDRLHCANPRCGNGCHRCLIAFETQRHEELLCRGALLSFLEPRWQTLFEQPVRDGSPVAAAFRGGAEVREAISNGTGALSVVVREISSRALDEDGWLRDLLHFAEGHGRLRLIVERLPDPDSDDERFISARLKLAMQESRAELLLAKPGAADSFCWRVLTADPACAFYIEQPGDDPLGPSWLRDGAAVYRAVGDVASEEILRRLEALVAECRVAQPDDLEPEPPPERIVVRTIRRGEPSSRASFDYWFRGPDDTSLFGKPLAELHVCDPYLATDWQLKLLSELIDLGRASGCKKFRVDTYAPREDNVGYGLNRTVSADEQRNRISKATGNDRWAPLAPPTRNLDRMHKRTVTGTRVDGSRFEVLLERGIDFIIDVGRGTRSTRESYLVIRDPAD